MRVNKTRLCAVLILGSFTASEPAFARERSVPAKESAYEIIEEIVVSAHPLSAEGLSQASELLQGAELHRKSAGSIGETLGREPGIHSASFGNAVGRPVIHGLGGPRVRIMADRIDTLDVSVTSADHAVTIEPFIAERIEVIKGPSALLYGSGATGGVIDVHTGRIPHVVPETPFTGGVETRFDDNTNGNTTAAKLNGGAGKFAWHLDASFRDGDDYTIPGFAESAQLRALEAAETEVVERGEGDAEVRGELPGSSFDAESYAVGAAYIFERGFFGISVSKTDSDYRLPGGHGHNEEEEGNPLLTLEQTRTDLELGVRDPVGVFSALNVRFGFNDYEHQEIEPNGEIATTFMNEAWELRAELTYDLARWNGAFGVQHMDRDFSAVGEEAFVPPVKTRESGVFWVTERAFDGFDLEGGLRIGQLEHRPQSGDDQEYITYAMSLGIVAPFGDSWQLGATVDRSSRAPVSEELFSNGPHLVTNAFEIGDPNLASERSTSVAATLRFDNGIWGAVVTTYATRFSGFIYEQAIDAEQDGLPVFQFRQNDARFLGIDLEANVVVARWERGVVNLRASADYTDAELDVAGNDNVPRIPPLRYGLGLDLTAGKVFASLDYQRVNQQKDVSPDELSTRGFNDLRAYVGITLPAGKSSLKMFAQGKNLTNDEQRLHTSFIKDIAPAPGRMLEFGIRLIS